MPCSEDNIMYIVHVCRGFVRFLNLGFIDYHEYFRYYGRSTALIFKHFGNSRNTMYEKTKYLGNRRYNVKKKSLRYPKRIRISVHFYGNGFRIAFTVPRLLLTFKIIFCPDLSYLCTVTYVFSCALKYLSGDVR